MKIVQIHIIPGDGKNYSRIVALDEIGRVHTCAPSLNKQWETLPPIPKLEEK